MDSTDRPGQLRRSLRSAVARHASRRQKGERAAQRLLFFFAVCSSGHRLCEWFGLADPSSAVVGLVVVVVAQVFRGILVNDALKEFKAETHILRRLRHPNVILFMGTCTQKREMCIVTGTTLSPPSPIGPSVDLTTAASLCRVRVRLRLPEFMSRGSLNLLLKDESVELGWDLIVKIVRVTFAFLFSCTFLHILAAAAAHHHTHTTPVAIYI